jgi:Ca2+/Na+ antiporter
MTVKHYLLIVVLSTLLAGASLGLLLTGTRPETATGVMMGMLYGSVFLFIAGVLALLGTVLRTTVLHKHDAPSRQILIATRQAILLSLLLTLGLYLQAHRQLHGWVILAMIGGVTLLEMLFISVRIHRPSLPNS